MQSVDEANPNHRNTDEAQDAKVQQRVPLKLIAFFISAYVRISFVDVLLLMRDFLGL
jgi:hypothetical protein